MDTLWSRLFSVFASKSKVHQKHAYCSSRITKSNQDFFFFVIRGRTGVSLSKTLHLCPDFHRSQSSFSQLHESKDCFGRRGNLFSCNTKRTQNIVCASTCAQAALPTIYCGLCGDTHRALLLGTPTAYLPIIFFTQLSNQTALKQQGDSL